MSDKKKKLSVGETAAVMKRLFGYFSNEKKALGLCCFAIFVSTALLLIGPPILQYIVDLMGGAVRSGTEVPFGQICGLALVLVAAYIISSAIQMVSNRTIARKTNKLVYNIRNDINAKTNRLSVDSVKTRNKGDIVSLVMNDSDQLGTSTYQIIVTLVSAITTLVGSTILMFLTEWRLALATLIVSAVCVFAVMFMVRKNKRYFVQQQESLANLTSFVTENYNANRIINLYGGKEDAMKKFVELNTDVKANVWRTTTVSSTVLPLMSFAMYFSTAVVMLVASNLIIHKQSDIGVLVAFLLYVKIFFNPLIQLSNGMVVIESAFAGAKRIFEYLDAPEMPQEVGCGMERLEGDVEFRNVCFGYNPDMETIHDFSLKVEPGQKIAIVGRTGAGKTTIVNLLMKFYDITSGDILIDGISIKDMSREEVHDQFCMILQDTWIFKGTWKENITFCRSYVTDDDVRNVCDAVGLTAYVARLPDGLDTEINEGNSLSEGQRQQIAIARAMLDRKPMLILDEATSSLDTKLEKQIQEIMDGLTVGRTSFVIAHRLSTIKNANVIVVMDKGRIVEIGKHEELVNRDGAYRDIYISQFKTSDE